MSFPRFDEFSELIYMAHRLGAATEQGMEDNRVRAMMFLKRLQELNVRSQIIAPWITESIIYDDHDPQQRLAGLERCKFTLSRCDELWLTRAFGERCSAGMVEEAAFAMSNGIPVKLWTEVGRGWQLEEIRDMAHLNGSYIREADTEVMEEDDEKRN